MISQSSEHRPCPDTRRIARTMVRETDEEKKTRIRERKNAQLNAYKVGLRFLFIVEYLNIVIISEQ